MQIERAGVIQQIRLRVDRADTTASFGVSEVEFWGQRESNVNMDAATYPTEEGTVLELSNASAHSAKQNLHIDLSVSLFGIRHAELVYDVYNLESYTDGYWEINGQGEHYLTPRGMTNDWATVVEDIDPGLLLPGKNTISFQVKTSKKNGLRIRNVYLKLYFDTGEKKFLRVEGTGFKEELLPNLIDGDEATVWQTDWQVYDQMSLIVHLAEKIDVERLAWLQGKAFLDGVRVEYSTPEGWRLFAPELGANELVEGWNTLRASETVETDQFRFTLLNPRGKQMIGPLKEIRVWGSSTALNQNQSPIEIAYPGSLESVGTSFPLKALVKGKYDRVTVNGTPVKVTKKHLDKEIRFDELPGDTHQRSLTVEAYQGAALVGVQSLTVIDLPAPILTITAPVNNYLTNAAQVAISGSTDSVTNTLTVNGVQYNLSSTNFTVNYPIAEGLNKLTITVKNSGGMQTSKVLYVNRDTHTPVIHFDEDYSKAMLYTGQTSLRMTGYVEEYSSCKLYVNNVEVPLQYGAFEYIAPIVQGKSYLDFRAVDQLNQESTSRVCLNTDSTEPAAFTLGVPGGWVSGRSVQVTFATTDVESDINHYEIQVDNLGYVNATSPYVLTNLPTGLHTVSVKAVNNVGLSKVASAQLRVDAEEPIAFLPTVNPAGWSQTRTPVVNFATTDATSGINHYELKVDAGAFLTVQSPYTLPSLAEGVHTVTVKAVDNAGLSTMASVQVGVDTAPPAAFTPMATPAGLSNTNRPVLTFQTTDASSGIDRFEVRVDNGDSILATSPYTLPVLSDGVHTITVRAVDKVGLSTSGTAQVNIDTQAPLTPTNFGVISDDGIITAKWSAGGETDLARYRLYRYPAWSSGETKEIVSSLILQYVDNEVTNGGSYTYYLVAMDQVGNISNPTTSLTRIAGVVQVEVSPTLGATLGYGDVITMEVPIGAMQETATIQLAPALSTEVPKLSNSVISYGTYNMGVVDPNSPDGTTLKEDAELDADITVTIGYAPNLIPVGDGFTDLGVYYFSKADDQWVKIPYQDVDLVNHTLTFTTNQFAMYNIQIDENYSPAAEEYKDLGVAPYGTYFQNNEEFVSPFCGILTMKTTDINLPGRNGFNLVLGRVYSSAQAIWDSTNKVKSSFANFGPGWRLNVPRIENTDDGQYLYLEDGTAIKLIWAVGEPLDGFRTHQFIHQEGTYFVAYKKQAVLDQLTDSYEVYFKDGTRYIFGIDGKLLQKIGRTGENIITFRYSNDHLVLVKDSLNREVVINYGINEESNKIKSFVINNQAYATFEYSLGNLSSVENILHQKTKYDYEKYEYKWGGTFIGYARNSRTGEEVPRDEGVIRSRHVPLISKITYPMGGISKYSYLQGRSYEKTINSTKTINGILYYYNGTAVVCEYKLPVISQVQYLSDMSTNEINPISYGYSHTYIYTNVNKYIDSLSDTKSKSEDSYLTTIFEKYRKTVMQFSKDGLSLSKSISDLTDLRGVTQLSESYTYNSHKEVKSKGVFHGGNSKASYYLLYEYDDWGNLIYQWNTSNNAKYYYRYLNSGDAPINNPYFLQFDQTQPAVNEHIHNLLVDEFCINEDKVNAKSTPEQTHYVYDAYGNITLKARRHGSAWVTTGYEYDSVLKGNLITITDPAGVTSLAYDTATKAFVTGTSRTVQKNADGPTAETILTEAEYNTLLGLKTADTNPRRVGDPNVVKTQYDYDELGRLTFVRFPDDTATLADNLVKLQIYDDTHNITTVANVILGQGYIANLKDYLQARPGIDKIDPVQVVDGRVTFNGGVITEDPTDAANGFKILNMTRYVYDSLNRLTEIRQYLRNDELKNVNGQQQASPFVTKFAYDEVGNRISEIDAEGKVTVKKYDGLKRLIGIDYPKEPTDLRDYSVKIIYDLYSNKRTVIDQENYWAEEIKDWNGNVVEVAKYEKPYDKSLPNPDPTALGKRYSSQVAYDTLGNQIQVIDGNGQVYGFVYDDWNQLVENILPATQVIVPTPGTNPENRTPALITPRIKYEYDNLGRKTAEIAPNGNSTGSVNNYRTEYEYDALDRPIKSTVKRPEGDLVTKNYYDAAGRLIKVTDPKNQSLQKVYNAQGWVMAEIDPLQNITYHQYNPLGKETAVTNPEGVSTTYSSGKTGVKINNVQYYLDPKYTTQLTYDSLSRLTQSVDLNGNTLSITYDTVGAKSGELFTAADKVNKRLTSYTYTPQYWLKSVTQGEQDGLNYKVEYQYDRVGNKIKEIYPSIEIKGQLQAREYNYQYDNFGRLVTLINPDNSSETYGYDNSGNRTAVTNGRKYTTTYEYNGLGKLSKVVEPGNISTQYFYDPNGNLVRKVAANNLKTDYGYNERNLMTDEVRKRDSSDMIYKYAYDEVGQVKVQLDPRGIISAFNYDAAGKLVEQINYVPTSGSASVALQQVTVNTVPVGYAAEAHVSYVYDKRGNVTNVTDSLGTQSMSYDGQNRMTSETRNMDGKSYTFGYEYDFAGNLISIQYPLADSGTTGSTGTTSTGTTGVAITGTAGTGTTGTSGTISIIGGTSATGIESNTVTYRYDSLNHLTSVGGFADTLQNDPISKNFMYDANGNLVKMTLNDNTVTTIVPDIMCRPAQISVTVPESSSTSRVALNLVYMYDANGNVTNRNNNTYSYDELDRLSTAEIDGTIFVNTPSKVGYATADYFLNNEMNYECDNVQLHFDYVASTLGFQFDTPRKIDHVELYTTGAANHRITGKGIRVFAQSSASGTFTEIPAKDWNFSKNTQTEQITITFKTPVVAYMLKIHANYDNRDIATDVIKDESTFVNSVKSMARVYARTDRTRIHYEYDAVGNRTAEHLTDVFSNYSVTYNYSYYGNSDRLRTRESQPATNLKTQGGYINGTLSYGPNDQKAYTYDKAGNLIEKGNSYTLSGNVPQILPTGNEVEYWKYSYDSQNQLTTVWKNGTANANIIVRFAYDYAGKRLKAVEGNNVTHYLYGFGGQLLSEVKYTTTASDPFKATGTDLQQSKVTSYVYALGHQLAKVDGSIAGGSKYYYHNDNLGSTMMMTKKVDDATRQNPIVFMQDYTPFGQNLHEPGEPAATNETEATLKFTGQIEDADIGLCYYNARYYDPEIGRFTQEDSYRGNLENPLTQNLYIYTLDNPLRYIDPTGHENQNANALPAVEIIGPYALEILYQVDIKRVDAEKIEQLIKEFQVLAGVSITGKLDFATLSRLNQYSVIYLSESNFTLESWLVTRYRRSEECRRYFADHPDEWIKMSSIKGTVFIAQTAILIDAYYSIALELYEEVQASKFGEMLLSRFSKNPPKLITTNSSDCLTGGANQIRNHGSVSTSPIKSVDDILQGTTPGRETKGRATQYEKSGGFEKALEDFNSMGVKGVKEIPGGKVGKLPDGRTVNVRVDSSDSRPTLEIYDGKKSIKIRYNK